MANIKNHFDLQTWPVGKPAAYARALAARTAMRVLPVFSLMERSDLTLSVWRANFISWVACSYPTLEIYHAANAADNAAGDAANAAYAAESLAAYPANAARAAVSAYSTGVIRYAVTAVDAADAADLATRTTEAIYAAINSDASYLEQVGSNAPSLMVLPLWLVPAPSFFQDIWPERRSEFRRWGDDWEIWIDWYEQRIEGRNVAFSQLPIPYDDITPSIAMASKAFWDRPPSQVNAEIKARLDAATPPIMPPRQPAAINPVWVGEQLVHQDTVSSNASSQSIEALMGALAEDFSELANDLIANIPPKTTALLERVSAQIKALPGRIALFRLTSRLIELEQLSPTVRAEWSDEDSARYHALYLQLANLLNTHPELRDYMLALPRPEHTVEEVEAISVSAESFISDLRAEGTSHIDASIVDNLEAIRSDVLDDLGPMRQSYSQKQALGSVESLIASIGAVLHALIAKVAPAYGVKAENQTTKEKSSDQTFMNELGSIAGKSVKKTLREKADKTGDFVFDTIPSWTMSALKRIAAAYGLHTATPLAVEAAANISHLDTLAKASPAIAILLSLLPFIMGVKPPQSKTKNTKDKSNTRDEDDSTASSQD